LGHDARLGGIKNSGVIRLNKLSALLDSECANLKSIIPLTLVFHDQISLVLEKFNYPAKHR